jgi:methyl-accepting chemotaxis protein
LFIIVGVLAAIIILIGKLIKKFKDLSVANRLEKVNQQLENLSSLAEDASQKLQEIADAKDRLNEMSSTLEGLTKGTLEWKKALMENNEEVLKLIETYPELSNYMTRGENGELTISEEGFDVLQER